VQEKKNSIASLLTSLLKKELERKLFEKMFDQKPARRHGQATPRLWVNDFGKLFTILLRL
jgi:hypothetical protein